ncbi:Conserved_hypothetical protein [Hexamita inflata]|uniref:Myb-like domain-containing protein n=1 Tax=Hexamita inflata TaxID=28002 RepID=A0AA86THB6_9EUKA|nr:Conserved hypothetical protein [Hexamita inflata]
MTVKPRLFPGSLEKTNSNVNMQCALQTRTGIPPHIAVQFIPPQMSYHFWTEEEGALLVAAVKKYGFRWEEIQFKVFPGLSVAKLKNKFYSDRRFKADAALPLTDEEKLGLKRRKRAPVPVEAKEAPSSEVDVDQLMEVLKQLIK